MKKIFAVIITLIITTTFATTFAVALFDSPYIGNANTMRFHYASCRSVDEMNPDNQVPLYSVDEAQRKGYVPCKRCKP